MGACKLVWKDGYELHVSVPVSPAATAPGQAQATVDLGEIHQAAVTTTTGAALVVSGRGIRSLKRRHHMALGQLAKKRKRCQPGSRRSRRLWAARRRVSARKRRQIRDLRHKGTRQVIAFCQAAGRGTACSSATHMACADEPAGATTTSGCLAGNTARTSPTSPTKRKAASIGASLVLSGERASQCPVCGWKQKVKGRRGAAAIPSVLLPGAPGCGRQRQHAPAGLWEPGSPSPLTSRINEQAP